MNTKSIISFFGVASLLCACGGGHPVMNVSSPDGTISLTLDNEADGLFYSVNDGDMGILSPSRLGFVLAGGERLDSFDIKKSTLTSHDETWETT